MNRMGRKERKKSVFTTDVDRTMRFAVIEGLPFKKRKEGSVRVFFSLFHDDKQEALSSKG